ncbi:MAG: deoxyribodipyrimidine photo-lyase [Steroidobacteraceae bacterium]
MTATLLWLRQDLRLRDNDALRAAAARGQPVLPVYIWSPQEEGLWPPGAASRWWLHHSLAALDADLRRHGLRLILRRGAALEALRALIRDSGATAVYWNRRYEPAAQQCSSGVKQALRRDGVEVRSFNSTLLLEPADFLNQCGKPYQVYTPFMRQVLQRADPPSAHALPRTLPAPSRWPASDALDSLELLPRIPWYRTMAALWQPGERGAQQRLKSLLHSRIQDYAQARDLPAADGTSKLSAHLHFGEIGPRQLWQALDQSSHDSVFRRELIWREFGYHLLHHFPHTPDQPLREEFAHFPWARGLAGLAAWQRGGTGVPLVDAGMRQLWHSGVMHNRARMVTGSFLVKNLRLPWQEGARWFWDTLVDADLASNTLNWQWLAGSGADAAPYFRIFNPVLQGKRFDSQGRYVRRWVPELARLSERDVHAPWLSAAPPPAYPAPIVDLNESRAAALEAYKSMRAQVAIAH